MSRKEYTRPTPLDNFTSDANDILAVSPVNSLESPPNLNVVPYWSEEEPNRPSTKSDVTRESRPVPEERFTSSFHEKSNVNDYKNKAKSATGSRKKDVKNLNCNFSEAPRSVVKNTQSLCANVNQKDSDDKDEEIKGLSFMNTSTTGMYQYEENPDKEYTEKNVYLALHINSGNSESNYRPESDKNDYISKADTAIVKEALTTSQSHSQRNINSNNSRVSFNELRGSSTVNNEKSVEEDLDSIKDKCKVQSLSSQQENRIKNTISTPRRPDHLQYPPSGKSLRPKPEDLSGGVLPDVLMTMRQKIESLTLFDSDMMKLTENKDYDNFEDDDERASKESLRRSFQQSISAAVLVSLAHKKYERRRLAAMEIEKVVRSLTQQGDLERVRAILLLLSDDYVRSTNEDARKGGVVALAACSIGLKKASETSLEVVECKDLILASVVHACQDHSQRVRYYATESLFNVIKVIPGLAIQHFFILFEILRSLYSDVDLDVRSGAQLLDKKLKEVIVAAINNGSFTVDQCVPLFARYVHVRNKPPSKRLTLTWLQEFSVQLVGSPMLQFLHLFLGGIFAMLSDPTPSIVQLALSVLETVLPQLLVTNEDIEDASMAVDFDKILQSLVTTMEHPDPFVRKVAMYWMSRIVTAHMSEGSTVQLSHSKNPQIPEVDRNNSLHPSTATISLRNSLPHVLPGILLSIGDNFRKSSANNDSFLPDLTTHVLAEQTNTCLQNAVRRDGNSYVSHLDAFILALREELDCGLGNRISYNSTVERKPYRMDVKADGTGIEKAGWFYSSEASDDKDDSVIMPRLCCLQWIIVLYESVVPDALKSEYAREFISPIIHQFIDNPPEVIIFKSLEVLAKITVPVDSEVKNIRETKPSFSLGESSVGDQILTDTNADYALGILKETEERFKSRDREVFAAFIHLHSHHHRLLEDFSRIIEYMCTLQPPEFIFVSFSLEIDNFIKNKQKQRSINSSCQADQPNNVNIAPANVSQINNIRDLEFAAAFVHQLSHVLLTSQETLHLRKVLQDCIGSMDGDNVDKPNVRLFQILLNAFAHNFVAALSLCFWGGAFLTASMFLESIDPLDINIMFYLELDQLIEHLERPLFRHLHLRLLQYDGNHGSAQISEGSGRLLFRVLKSILMLLPQSTSYKVLRRRLLTVAKFRQNSPNPRSSSKQIYSQSTLTVAELLVSRLLSIRKTHCSSRRNKIRSESLYSDLYDHPVTLSLHNPTSLSSSKGDNVEASVNKRRFEDIALQHRLKGNLLQEPSDQGNWADYWTQAGLLK